MPSLKQKSLNYHKNPQPGKINISPSKPCETQDDLSLAYSPGVAYPCLEIKDDPEEIYTYTGKGNTVAIITNGTAVLGLGNIGATASIPVMEGKAVLLKKFAGINGVPLAIKHKSIDEFIEIVASLEANFGAINLEDIKAPECFEIERVLQEKMNIPVFHDDQHGTAIISLAGLLNALELVGKKLKEAQIVINGAGAAGIACASLYVAAGAQKENITFVDTKGVIYKGRKENMNPYKRAWACKTKARTLEQALISSDVFVGVSTANILTKKMIQNMAPHPIIFALANPEPEIMPEKAYKYGAYIVATGRSDFPNQVNNVLGFPGIFKGALDVHAKTINTQMKLAAARALAELAKERIPKEIQTYFAKVYIEDSKQGMFKPTNPLAPNYIIPKPFDPRVVPRVARYVAQAARKTQIAII